MTTIGNFGTRFAATRVSAETFYYDKDALTRMLCRHK